MLTLRFAIPVASRCSARAIYRVSERYRRVPPEISATNMLDYNNDGLWAVAATTDQFGYNFVQAAAKENPGNLISSPFSAQVVLAMAAYGAGDTTATQMRSALLIPSDDELALSGYQAIVEALNAPEGVELRLANKIYTSDKIEIKPDYEELTEKKFLSASEKVDFEDVQATADTINSWCEEQTNNRIKDVINPDSISSDTALVLVNAVYFKGEWDKKFEPEMTEDRPFHLDETSTTDVPTMFIKDKLRFGELPDVEARFIEIPYKGGELCMLIVLPNEVNGLGTVLENMNNPSFKESLHEGYNRDVELFLPKFKIESSMDLRTVLENLGMTDMFQCNADFSGIADLPMKVSKVVQKAFIEVNEEGSEAAAATAVTITLRCAIMDDEPPVVFDVNRPFYYSIRHSVTKIPLFAGVIHLPNTE